MSIVASFSLVDCFSAELWAVQVSAAVYQILLAVQAAKNTGRPSEALFPHWKVNIVLFYVFHFRKIYLLDDPKEMFWNRWVTPPPPLHFCRSGSSLKQNRLIYILAWPAPKIMWEFALWLLVWIARFLRAKDRKSDSGNPANAGHTLWLVFLCIKSGH